MKRLFAIAVVVTVCCVCIFSFSISAEPQITRMKKRGYQFISLDEALRDKAYKSEDRFIARAGISWLQRWAFTQKHQPTIEQFKLEPDAPEFIKQAYGSRKQF